MRKGLVWGVLLAQVSFAFQDSDLDGVEDSVDRCPNTPILALVDRFGCPVEEKKGRLYLRVGGGFVIDRGNSDLYSLLSIAYSYRKLYASFTTRYYLSGPGLGDSSLFLGYSDFVTERLYILPGVRLKLPTGSPQYSDGSLDLMPSITLDYLLDGFDVFAFAGYTFRWDPGLRNTLSFSLGGGYDFTKKLYASLSYDASQSPVRSGWNSYLSLFALYDVSSRVYTTFSSSVGLNPEATDLSLSFRVGFRF